MMIIRKNSELKVERKELTGRAQAITALAKWFRTHHFPDRILTTAEGKERSFAMEITYGTLRNLSLLDYVVSQFCRKTPGPLPKAALLIGAWQLLLADNIPDHAAIAETVNAVKTTHAGQPGFINAVLRNIARSKGSINEKIASLPPHIRYSHPKDFAQMLTESFGAETAEVIMAADNLEADTIAAPLPYNDRNSAGNIINMMKAVGIEATLSDSPAIPCSFPVIIPHGVRIESLPGYKEGKFIIQDPATHPAISMTAPEHGETILDCCAAPGGKTMQIAALLAACEPEKTGSKGDGKVIALDSTPDRLQILKENIARTKLDKYVIPAVADATTESLHKAVKAMAGNKKINAALIDAPCSNSGVLRRRPDARWRWTKEETDRLASVQLSILKNVAALSPDRIVYSTCSIDPKEDEEVIKAFLQSEAGQYYKLTAEQKLIPTKSSDGAYAALVIRVPRTV